MCTIGCPFMSPAVASHSYPDEESIVAVSSNQIWNGIIAVSQKKSPTIFS